MWHRIHHLKLCLFYLSLCISSVAYFVFAHFGGMAIFKYFYFFGGKSLFLLSCLDKSERMEHNWCYSSANAANDKRKHSRVWLLVFFQSSIVTQVLVSSHLHHSIEAEETACSVTSVEGRDSLWSFSEFLPFWYISTMMFLVRWKPFVGRWEELRWRPRRVLTVQIGFVKVMPIMSYFWEFLISDNFKILEYEIFILLFSVHPSSDLSYSACLERYHSS